MSEQASNSLIGQAVDLTVQASGEGSWVVWDALGTMYIASSHEELGRAALGVLRNPDVPRVERSAGGAGRAYKAIDRALSRLVSEADDERDRPAVVVSIVLGGSGEQARVAVWDGRGRVTTPLGEDGLGADLARIIADDKQPRVPSGAPPDPSGDLWDKGVAAAAQFIPGMFGSE